MKTSTAHTGQLLTTLPDPPDHLNETGQLHYCSYGGALIQRQLLFDDMLPTLIDLAWWEQLKEAHRQKVDELDAVHEYHNEDGSLKHSQPTGWFSNLKTITDKVRKLKKDLALTPENAKANQPDPQQRERIKNF